MGGRQWLKKLIEFLIPQTCLCCDSFIENDERICRDCDLSLYPLRGPACPKCALPQQSKGGVDALCFRCISENRYFDKVFAAYEYEGNAKQIFSRAKYGRREDTIKSLASLAIERGELKLPCFLNEAIWISVPMHRKDLRQRGFNTARIILDSFAKVDANLVRKTIPRERGNTKIARDAFSRKAFELKDSDLRGVQRVVIVDDVMSTGSTLSAIARCLKKAGVKEVYSVVLARNI